MKEEYLNRINKRQWLGLTELSECIKKGWSDVVRIQSNEWSRRMQEVYDLRKEFTKN